MKRAFDLTVTSFLLVFLLPVLLSVAVIVRIQLGAPILFTQRRPGLNGELFTIYKFRTMTDERNNDDEILQDAERLGWLGKLLRASSLDELPELWNALKGDMSLVGPRPLLIDYLPLYNKEQARRHEVKPGITGWAQINGRNALCWEDKFKLDIWYVDNRSLILDIEILWKTVISVLKREGINQKNHATMEPFRGNDI